MTKCIIFTLFLINYSSAWDSKQLEVFDAVEEVQSNFYEILNVAQVAEAQEIKSAFRSQSKVVHPDKNTAENADEQFRHLVTAYEILRDDAKRRYYDEVLSKGLPNWRSAVYYYRKVRNVSFTEMSVILFIIISVGHYLVIWASYFEQKYIIEQARARPQKKAMYFQLLSKPSLSDTLPVQIIKLLWTTAHSLPYILYRFKEKALEKVEKAAECPVEENPVIDLPCKRRRKPGFVIPEGPTFEISNFHEEHVTEEIATAPVTGGLWTDDDLVQLVNLVKRYPGGVLGRWDLIAKAIDRTVPEVIYMANKMKSMEYFTIQETEQSYIKKQKTHDEDDVDQELSPWSQTQQQALERALAKYPKGSADRWDRIASLVPNKTKEECIMRFKHLAVLLKKQRTINQSSA